MTIARFFDLSGQVAVVTGAGFAASARASPSALRSRSGCRVAARRGEEVERVAKDLRGLGRRAVAVPTDVTDGAAVEALAKRAVAEFGALDIWVNNAGGSPIAVWQLVQLKIFGQALFPLFAF